LKEINELTKEEEIPKFFSIFINCIKLKTKKESFKIVWNELKQEYFRKMKKILKIGKEAESLSNLPTKITQYFEKFSNNPFIVIVIDEIDFLINKEQQEIYEFFNWLEIF
jgi:Cdc6-like AAA superfamily ATPase